ncbi:Transmembrane protein [Trema orientale]|uniref:Transmembrane protein n=1 Tax=Trema orientale TaxID=63057 RepID=A0A2P5FEK0_TREOI|nr:Transmembrane protein [Trema orientale]
MEIMSEEGETMTMLYEASMAGSVAILNSLIQKQPLILNKISLTPFAETPLHISALLGHLHFTRQLLAHNPRLASQLDSLRRSPLHLASAEGHVEIVKALLDENQDMCVAKDQEGRIPLHYAAMRGHVDVIELLISSRQSSVFHVIPHSGETVLHLCVQYNCLEALKVLVRSAGYDNTDFLNSKDQTGGNTILHLAVMLKQIETIEYLASIPRVLNAAENTLNQRGLKPSDLVDNHLSSDFKTLKIQRILTNPTTSTLNNPQSVHSHQIAEKTEPSKSKLAKRWGKWVEYLKENHKNDLSQKTHNSLMVVATVIASMTFQTAISPPGGVWQDNTIDNHKNPDFDCSENHTCIAGTAIFAYSDVWRDDYITFAAFNSVSFLASLAVILLLISGLPLRNKFGTWALTMAMCVTLAFTGLTFLQGLYLVTPDDIMNSMNPIFNLPIYMWIGLLGLIGFFHTIRFVSWVLFVKKLRPNFGIRLFYDSLSGHGLLTN